MAELVNPYIAGAPVTEARMFFGREDVFQWIENSLAGQYADHILVIHGQRRVGKTSVLKQLGNRLPQRYIPVFFDLQGRTHTTLDRFLWWLARETVRVLKQDRNIEVPLPEKEAFASDLEYFEHRFLPDLKPVLGDGTLLLTFDEFDNLEESEIKEELARPLIDYLRRLMGSAGLSFIFSIGSSGRKLENMQAAYTEFFKTALYKKISFLNEDQTRNLITRPVENIIEYDKNAVTRIYQIAGGHPYFTQLTCHELFAKCQQTDDRHIQEADVESVLDDVVERGTVNLKFVWDEASDIEKWALAALAQLDKTDNRALADYLRKQRIRFSESDLTSGLLHLREKDVLTQENRFVIHLLKLWLQKNRPIEQAREELTEVNPIANRYIEIGLEFKDAGVYDKAIESFQEALAIAKDNIQAQVNIALTYMDQKAYNTAIVEFEKALTMDDEDVSARAGLCEAHLALGDAAMHRNRPREAIQSYQRVLGINAEHTEARGRMAEITRQRAEKALTDGRDEEALSAFAEALKYTPEDPILLGRVEQVRVEKKAKVLATQFARSEKEAEARNWERAIAALNEALETAPGDETILKKIVEIKGRQLTDRLKLILARADQAEKSNRWDAAIAALKEYLSLKEDDEGIQKRLADLIEAKHSTWLKAILTRTEQAVAYQRWEDAFEALNEVLSLEPENAEIQKRMEEVRKAQRTAKLEAILKQAEQAAQAGKWDEAIDVLNNGVALAPEDERLQARLARVLDAKRTARLKAALRLAETAAQSGKWNVALDSLKEILAVEPDNLEVQNKLTEIQKRQRESRLAALRTQARAMARLERFDEALSAWQEYLALEPEDREKAQAELASVKKAQALNQTYGEAYRAYSNKNYDKAIDLFKSIIVENADYKDATRLLAEAIELRRTARKWWQSKFLWGGIGGAALLAVAWFIFRPGSPLMATLFAPTPAPVVTATSAVSVPSAIPTSTPTPLPLTWARLNSGQFLTRDAITTIVIDPSDPGVAYVGTQNAGIYKSIDGGLSWQPAQRGLASTSINSLVIDFKDPNILYAGVLQGGVYKTEDAGSHWYTVNTGIDTNGWEVISIVVMDPNNSRHLYYTNAFSSNTGKPVIYETQNGGESWEQVMRSSCPRSVGLVVHPNGSTLYAGSWGDDTCKSGVYNSEDGGKSWVNVGLPQEVIQFGGLMIDPQNGDRIYAYTRDRKLYGSTDGGKNWGLYCDSQDCRPLGVDPSGEIIVMSEGKLLRSTNGESQLSVLAVPEGNFLATVIAFSPSDPARFFLGEQGLMETTDSGQHWVMRNSGLGAEGFNLQLTRSLGMVLSLKEEPDTFRSTDQGRTWERFTDMSEALAFDAGGDLLYRLWQNGASYSLDLGKTWTSISLPLSNLNPDDLAASPQTAEKIYVAYSGSPIHIFYSSDKGLTWQEAKLTCSDQRCTAYNFTFLRSSNQEQRQYLRADHAVFTSDDDGATWVECRWQGTWIANSLSPLAVDPRDHDKLMVATNGEGVNITTDGCRSWKPSNAGLGSLFVNTIVIDPKNPDTVYAGTDGGAYVSYNGGETWGEVNDGLLGATVVYSIVVDKDSNVYAATPYGIFKLEGK